MRVAVCMSILFTRIYESVSLMQETLLMCSQVSVQTFHPNHTRHKKKRKILAFSSTLIQQLSTATKKVASFIVLLVQTQANASIIENSFLQKPPHSAVQSETTVARVRLCIFLLLDAVCALSIPVRILSLHLSCRLCL